MKRSLPWLKTCSSFIDAVGDQTMVVGRDYEIMMVNAAFVRNTGLSEVEIVGRRCHEVTHRSAQPCWMAGEACPLAAVMETGEAVSVSHVHLDAAGNERNVDIVGSPVRDAEGQLVGMIESIRDVTEKKLLEDAVRQRNLDLEDARRKRDEFTRTICHELKNILNVLSLHAQVIRRAQAPQTEDHADRIVDGARRLARLVEDMQDTAAIESQRFSIRRAPCELGALARRCVEERQLASPDHRIIVAVPREKLEGEWDAARLRQVLDNLISNAVKFSPTGGEVHVNLGSEANRVSVSVTDAGLGIPAARVQDLFQPYSRAHAHIPGLGLGLFVSRGIIEAHGGEIRVVSREGQGSTFRFVLPVGPPT